MEHCERLRFRRVYTWVFLLSNSVHKSGQRTHDIWLFLCANVWNVNSVKIEAVFSRFPSSIPLSDTAELEYGRVRVHCLFKKARFGRGLRHLRN